jgi:hypothetical protein
MKAYRSRGIAPLSLNRGTVGQLHAPVAFIPGNNPSTHWTGSRVGLRARLDLLLEYLRYAASFMKTLVSVVQKQSHHVYLHHITAQSSDVQMKWGLYYNKT